MNARRRVLVSAFACNPYRGSEDGVGWGWAKLIASLDAHDVHVITAEFQRPAIERWIAEHPGKADGLRFHYVPRRPWHYRPTPAWVRVETSPLKPLMNVSYSLWLKDAYHLASRLHAERRFDLVHLVTYVGFRFPGRYWKMDVPFVWGPVGGLENTPWRFLPLLGPVGALYYASRNVINTLQKRFQRGPRHAFRKARGGIIAATESIRQEIRRYYGEQSEVICEVGFEPIAGGEPSAREPGEPLRIAWSGEHLPGKALPLLLRALARVGEGIDWRLTILGRGPCTRKWRAFSRRLGIDDRCTWMGWIERGAAIEALRKAHLFVITSLKDLTSTVLLEALGQGLPVICPDHCGFSDVVTPKCGIKLAVDSPGQLAQDLAHAIRSLAEDEPRRRRLASGALDRSRDFGWEDKARRVRQIYDRVLGGEVAPTVRASAGSTQMDLREVRR